MLISGTYLSTMINNKMKRNMSSLQKTHGRLSSGLKINSAADDAAGMAISHRMKALIRGTEQASRNVQDAGSLVQTADGAMGEISAVLQRMRELTVQASNDTATHIDRRTIQDEISQLNKVINSIVVNTEFNQQKILSNVEPGEYIYENRFASKRSQLSVTSKAQSVQVEMNNVGSSQLVPLMVTSNRNAQLSPPVSTRHYYSESYIGTTVVDHLPRWTLDGQTISFDSTRDGGQYSVTADGSSDPVEYTAVPSAPQKTMTTNSLLRLIHNQSTLLLQQRSTVSQSWETIETYNYNSNDGSHGYSFSPIVDADGNTSFVYSDNEGNLKKVDVNVDSRNVTSGPIDLISNTDKLNFPPMNNTITLSTTPNLYKMNTSGASLQIQKVNDDGSRVLTYWDGVGEEPSGGYYTVSNREITFFGDAIIGAEEVDDAQDFYRFSYVSDSVQDNVHTIALPALADVYNMNGESGPRSLNIHIGGTEIAREHLLAERPVDVEGITGVFVDGENRTIEFFGDLRPAHNQTVSVAYRSDSDGRNAIYTLTIPTSIDTYNLTNSDLSTNRSLRVFVTDEEGNEKELMYDDTDGYMYNPANGQLSLHGDARPDVPTNTTIRLEYVIDASSSNTTNEVYGIPLGSSYPEIYNPGHETSPSSIRVFRNGSEEISYSDMDGFQYKQSTNTIEFFGLARPNTKDTYTIQMIRATGGISKQDEVVEVQLLYYPETYGVDESHIPSTFRVVVDGRDISYDPTKTDGFIYNFGTNRIEIYGDSRPDAGHPSSPDVQVYYVYESPSVIVGNETYDFRLNSSTLDYGIYSDEGPKAIRMYYNGSEIPYDETNGFTYNSTNSIVSLHGSYRPTNEHWTGEFRVYAISSNAIQTTIPPYSQIYKVELNGMEVNEAVDGDGYLYEGQTVAIVGSTRPDITNTTGTIQLKVSYYDSLDLMLDNSVIEAHISENCEQDTQVLFSEVDPDFTVLLNGSALSSDQYHLHGNRVVLDKAKVNLNVGDNTIEVDYRVRHLAAYQENDFTFQVGANSGQALTIEVASFNNLLIDTNKICVLNQESASQSIEVIDKAIQFVSGERGKMGAVQNRLEHIASNLTVLEETMISSVSRLEDADMAREVMNRVKFDLLSNIQLRMLTYSRQSNQRVLDLLK